MDATAGSKKAPPAANDDDAVPSAAQLAAERSSSSPESDATVAGMRTSGGEDDDEQVERFYALLDNIRAMRGMVSTGTTAGRKRAREAEPPWRPAFRMEDFEFELEEEVDSDPAGRAGEKKKKKRESSAKRPADDEEEGEVVEVKGPPQEQPQSHETRRAGALAVDT